LSLLISTRDEAGELMPTKNCNELITLLLAGHETTAAAWALYWIHRHPPAPNAAS